MSKEIEIAREFLRASENLAKQLKKEGFKTEVEKSFLRGYGAYKDFLKKEGAAEKNARRTVVCQEWLESEAGWGKRPDGCSIHLTNEDLRSFIEAYWDKMPKETPEEYSRPLGEPFVVECTKEVFRSLNTEDALKSKGIRIYERRYNDILTSGELKK